MCLLGLDIGTSGCKAGVFNNQGDLISFAYQEYPLYYPGNGYIEMDIDRVKLALQSAIHSVSQDTRSGTIEAIGITSLGDVITAINKGGKAIHNPIVDFDPRGAFECQALINKFGEEWIFETTGIPPSWTTSICKILWLLDHEPRVRSEVWKFLCFEDLVMHWLGLEPTIDYSLASRTMAFDIYNKEWSQDILDFADLTPEKFGKLCPSGELIGKVSSNASNLFGLPKGIPVITGAHDWICAAIGAGVISQDHIAVDVSGTMEGILVACDKPILTNQARQAGYSTFCHAIPDVYMTMGFLSTSGVILRWYRDNFAYLEWEEARQTKQDVYDIIIQRADQIDHSMLVMPYFSGRGTPNLDPLQTGCILGLTLESSRHEIVGAILEGLAFELRSNLEFLETLGLQVDEIRVVGGGARSNQWLQIKANITGRKVIAPNEPEASCKGAALLAGVGIGRHSVSEGINKWLREWKVFFPDPEKMESADYKYKRYQYAKEIVTDLNLNLEDGGFEATSR
jgi:xylulokinase